jgi:hypothetical protein
MKKITSTKFIIGGRIPAEFRSKFAEMDAKRKLGSLKNEKLRHPEKLRKGLALFFDGKAGLTQASTCWNA